MIDHIIVPLLGRCDGRVCPSDCFDRPTSKYFFCLPPLTVSSSVAPIPLPNQCTFGSTHFQDVNWSPVYLIDTAPRVRNTVFLTGQDLILDYCIFNSLNNLGKLKRCDHVY